MSSGSKKAILYALGANLGIALAKTGAALYTKSGAMLAEAIHSFADCANQALLLVGMRDAGGDRTSRHPMGNARASYFWSILVATLLFFVGGAFSVLEAVEHLKHPQPLNNPLIALGVLGVSVVLEAFSLYGALKESKKERGGKSLWRWFKESRSPELLVVTGEDIAALGGLAMAFVFVGLSVITGDPMWDAIGSLAVGVLLMAIAGLLCVEMRALIVGESLAPEDEAAVRSFLETHPQVVQLIDFIGVQHGHEWMLAVKLRLQPLARHFGEDWGIFDALDSTERCRRAADAISHCINEIEGELQALWPQARWCFVEPDVR